MSEPSPVPIWEQPESNDLLDYVKAYANSYLTGKVYLLEERQSCRERNFVVLMNAVLWYSVSIFVKDIDGNIVKKKHVTCWTRDSADAYVKDLTENFHRLVTQDE